MITVLIAEDEARIKGILEKVLKKEGYSFHDSRGRDSSVKIVKRDAASGMLSLQDKIVELEEVLLKEKPGVLYRFFLEAVERPLFEYILQQTFGNQLRAAKILGINRNTMRSKIRKLGINLELYKL
jgi:DNA-binding protein Fis